MGGVFINYRTGDGEFAATLITRALAAQFGQEHVFLASRSIRPGEDFAQKILDRLKQSDVLLAVIGSRWHSITGRRQRDEADASDDWVHKEIAEALRHGLRVIPVFLDHAARLSEHDLPAELAALARCQFLRLSHRNDTRDLARLIDELGDLVPGLVLNRVFTTTSLPGANLEPSEWLRTEYQVVPFGRRETELAELTAWTGTSKPVSAYLVTGPTGQGKTRLAQQLCEDLKAYGWVAGAVHDNAAIADLTNIGRIDGPLLVVVDQAETRFEQIHALADAMMQRAPTAPPARLLLLSRDTGEWLRRLRVNTDRRVGTLFQAVDEHPLAPLAATEAERRKEFLRAAAAYTGHIGVSGGYHAPPSDLDHPRYASVRTIHAAALLAVLTKHSGPDESVPSPDPELHRAARPESPYRGLQPFQERDARFFHGRDPQIRQLNGLIEQHSMVMVTGASGSGKSSLVRAGIFPLLRQQGVALATVRASAGVQPSELLARAVTSVLGYEPTRDVTVLADEIVEKTGHLVLFVDQFEELVAADPDAARDLLGLVAELVRAAPARPAATPALRAVFTGRSADLGEVLPAGLDPMPHTMSLPRMGPAELRAAIMGPSDLPLVSFEPGLVDRIIADAMDSPGQLPVVELALTRLWEPRQGGDTLTHRMYDDQGGVAGALASYAQKVYERQLLPDEQKLAERLLVQLARPGDGGTFALTPARFDQLDPASAELARLLAKHHLVVIRDDPGQPEVVLAHEALVQQWPRLREWLLAARDFRSWQEQLRIALGQWQRSNRDNSTLLRGIPLATAQDWLAEHPSRLTGDERGYITASRAHERRGTRRLRTITALIGVLALVATTSAALAINRNEELTDQLRRAAAASLGQESMRRSETTPLTALQLAQAAWHHGQSSPEAYAALLRQYLKYTGVEEIRPGLWSGTLNSFTATEDGQVIAVSEDDGKITIWTGLSGPAPRSWFVAAVPTQRGLLLSPDGRLLAVIGERGSVMLWDISQRSSPLPLRPADQPEYGETVEARSARFSPDGRSLVLTMQRHNRTEAGVSNTVEVWDVVRRRQSATGFSPAPGLTDFFVQHVEPDAENAWFTEYHSDQTHRNVLRDLATGAALRDTPAAFVTRGGLFVDCRQGPDGSRISVVDPTTGAVRTTRAVLGCPALDGPGLTDLTGRYAIFGSRSGDDSFRQLDLIDLHTGRSYSVPAPPAPQRPETGFIGHSTENLLVTPGESGAPTVFVMSAGALLRLQPPIPSDVTVQPNLSDRPTATALSPDGRILVTLTNESPDGHFGLFVTDVTTRRRITGRPEVAAGKLNLGANPRVGFTPDGKQILALGDSGVLTVLLTADLSVVRTITVDITPLVAGTPAPIGIMPLTDDEFAVIRGDEVTVWRISTGEPTGSTSFLNTGDATPVEAMAWPARPKHVLTTSTAGVQLWELGSSPPVRTFLPRVSRAAPVILTEPAGPRVAVHYKDVGQLQIWNPEPDDARSPVIPVPGDLSSVAFAPGNRLITVSGDGRLRSWDLEIGDHVADFRAPGSPVGWWQRDNVLTAATSQGPLTIDMDPRHWIEQLCRINNRGYTPEESAGLPSGADHDAPCSSVR